MGVFFLSPPAALGTAPEVKEPLEEARRGPAPRLWPRRDPKGTREGPGGDHRGQGGRFSPGGPRSSPAEGSVSVPVPPPLRGHRPPGAASPAGHGELHLGGRDAGAERVKIPHGRHVGEPPAPGRLLQPEHGWGSAERERMEEGEGRKGGKEVGRRRQAALPTAPRRHRQREPPPEGTRCEEQLRGQPRRGCSRERRAVAPP